MNAGEDKSAESTPRANEKGSPLNAASEQKKEPSPYPLPASTQGEEKERPLTPEEEEAEVRRRLKALGSL